MADKKFPEDVRAKKVKELYKSWSDARKDWEQGAREDIDFYLGNHLTNCQLFGFHFLNQDSDSLFLLLGTCLPGHR